MVDKPYEIFAEVVDGKALDQFFSAMKQDFAVQGALMPDVHAGYSLPIGGVVATDGVVLPAWVGYDIGCGMCALPLKIPRRLVEENAKAIFDQIYRDVPVGFNINDTPSEGVTKLRLSDLTRESQVIADEKKWQRALGTLGGGNHFIEVGADATDRVWIVIHSGSRGVGHGIAEHYMKLASGGQKAREGHYSLRTDSEAGLAYINDMNWALEYALDNRREMMRRVVNAIARRVDMAGDMGTHLADWGALINRNHNHATVRTIGDTEDRLGGKTVWIHRKGATHAEFGMMGVIPGNMRDGSFIVRGKGNPKSLFSSSHGAGRVLGRRVAKEGVRDKEGNIIQEPLKLEDFEETMKGVVAKVGKSTLDESPFAYKNIFEVMRQQSDLVEVDAHVRPILNIKG